MICANPALTYVMPLVSFYTPRKHPKTFGFQGVQKETNGMIWVGDPTATPASAQISMIIMKKWFAKAYPVDLKQNSTSFSAQFEEILYIGSNRLQKNKSSHRRCSEKKRVLENFAIFSGKHLCWSRKVLFKRDCSTGVFS